jgi:hypothetical protein
MAEYVDAAHAYAEDVGPSLSRIDAILREEAKRAGQTEEEVLNFFATTNQHALAAINEFEQRAPSAFVANCRASPTLVREHVLAFSPLRDQYPSQMRDIDRWK